MIKVSIENKYDFGFDIEKLSKKILKTAFDSLDLNFDFSIDISIVSSKKIRALNSKNRNIDRTTDVLSFPSMESKKFDDFYKKINNDKNRIQYYDFSSKTIFIGDVIICYDKVLSQAKKYNHSIKREFSFLLLHSILHLTGYDHNNIKNESTMIKKQNEILERLKIYR